MNVGIGTEVAQFLFREYINSIFGTMCNEPAIVGLPVKYGKPMWGKSANSYPVYQLISWLSALVQEHKYPYTKMKFKSLLIKALDFWQLASHFRGFSQILDF